MATCTEHTIKWCPMCFPEPGARPRRATPVSGDSTGLPFVDGLTERGIPLNDVRVHRRRAPVPQQLPTAVLHPSPLNPRRSMDPDALRELGESVRAHGLLQPLVVRERRGDGYEVICGHRRLAAAQLVGVTHLDCMVRELTDAQAVEAMLAENSKRRDVPPLEESDALLRLVDWGQTPADLADRLGRGSKWVRDRLALGQLVAPLRDMLAERVLGLGSSVRLAQLPHDEQLGIAQRIEQGGWRRYSQRDVERLIARQALPLASAPWPQTEAYANRLACVECPHRSDRQADLFDFDEGARCLGVVCWRAKLDHWIAEETAAGRVSVVDGWPTGPAPDDEPYWFRDVGLEGVTVGTVAPGLPRTTYRTGDRLVERVDRDALVEQLAGHPDPEIAQAVSEYWNLGAEEHGVDAPAEPRRPSAAQRRDAMAALIDDIEARMAPIAPQLHLAALRLVVQASLGVVWDSTLKTVCQRRGWAKADLRDSPHPALDALSGPQLVGLLAELTLERQAASVGSRATLDGNLWLAMLDLLGVARPPHT